MISKTGCWDWILFFPFFSVIMNIQFVRIAGHLQFATSNSCTSARRMGKAMAVSTATDLWPFFHHNQCRVNICLNQVTEPLLTWQVPSSNSDLLKICTCLAFCVWVEHLSTRFRSRLSSLISPNRVVYISYIFSYSCNSDKVLISLHKQDNNIDQLRCQKSVVSGKKFDLQLGLPSPYN